MPRPRRPRPGAALALLLLALVAVTAWLGVTGLLAQRHLVAARAELASARETLVERDVDGARAAIEAAGARTQRARALTSDPLWRLAAAVPAYGATAQTTRGLAEAADELAREVLPQALEGAERVDPDRLRTPDGAIDLTVVRAATPPVAASAEDAERVHAAVEGLPAAHVVGRVADARAELASQAAELAGALRGGATALEIAPALLGEDRPRRYLMLVQQTAESRGTGGLIGGFVEITADAGRLGAVSQGSNLDLINGPIPVPPGVPQEYVDLYAYGDAFNTWQNVNLSPNLPMVARVVQARWQAQGGAPLDGVVMTDAVGLSQLLEGSPPLEVEPGRSVTPAELPEYLAVEQYRGLAIDPRTAAGRKDKLADAAQGAATRLVSGGGDTLSLLRGLGEAVRSGHLRMASDDPVLVEALAESGVDGGLPRDDAPFAYPVVYNSTGGKLDHFLSRRVTYRAEGCDGDFRRSTVTVELTNDAPATGLPPYLTIRLVEGGQIDSTDNLVALTVYATRGADLVRATVDGRPTAPEDPAGPLLRNAEEAGLPLWNLSVELPRGQTRVIELELEEPVRQGEPRVLEQPLSRPLAAQVDVPGC